MGAAPSTLARLVDEEFQRLSQGRAHIILDEILEFRLNSGGWNIKTDCIGLLFSIDRNKDGRFQLSELKNFILDWNSLGKDIQHHELQSVIHSLCMARFWGEIHPDQGLIKAVDWLVALSAHNHVPPKLVEATEVDTALLPPVTPDSAVASAVSDLGPTFDGPDCAPRTFDTHPSIVYIHQQNLIGLYRVLAHQGVHRQDLSAFTHVLQRAAEDRGLLELNDTTLDDWVPVPIVHDYCKEVLENCRQLAWDMGVIEIVQKQGIMQQPQAPQSQLDSAASELRAGTREHSERADKGRLTVKIHNAGDSTELIPPSDITKYGYITSSSPSVQSCTAGSDSQYLVTSTQVPPLRLSKGRSSPPHSSVSNSVRRSPDSSTPNPPSVDLPRGLSGSQMVSIQSRSSNFPVPKLPLGSAGHESDVKSSCSSPSAGGQHISPFQAARERAKSTKKSAVSSSSTNTPHVHARAADSGSIMSPCDSDTEANLTVDARLTVPKLKLTGPERPLIDSATQTAHIVSSHPIASTDLGSGRRPEVFEKKSDVPPPVKDSGPHSKRGSKAVPCLMPRQADMIPGGFSRVIPDEPTPRHIYRVSSSPCGATTSNAGHSSTLGSIRRSMLVEGGNSSSRQSSRQSSLSGGEVSLAGAPKGPLSSDVLVDKHSRSSSNILAGQSSRGSVSDYCASRPVHRSHIAASGIKTRTPRTAEWQSTTKDFSQPGTGPFRPPSRAGSTGSNQTVNSARSGNGRELRAELRTSGGGESQQRSGLAQSSSIRGSSPKFDRELHESVSGRTPSLHQLHAIVSQLSSDAAEEQPQERAGGFDCSIRSSMSASQEAAFDVSSSLGHKSSKISRPAVLVQTWSGSRRSPDDSHGGGSPPPEQQLSCASPNRQRVRVLRSGKTSGS